MAQVETVSSLLLNSAIAFVPTRLAPGQSTDGAVFYPTFGKMLGAGKLVVRTAAAIFEFPIREF